MTPTVVTIGSTQVAIYPTWVVITTADGHTVYAVPHSTDAYRRTAQEHGYGADTVALCKDHELVHVALAHWLGLSDSPTIAAVAVKSDENMELRGFEEAAVLAVQRYARAAGVDLIGLLACSA